MALLECRSGAEVLENYRRVRARLSQLKSPEPPPKPVVVPEPIPEPPRKIEIVVMAQPTSIPVHVYELEPVNVRRHPSVHRIVEVVCGKYQISRTDLLSARRTAHIVRLRQIAMYLAKTLTLKSLPEIGRNMGGRDHTTVLHGVRKITGLRPNTPELDQDLTELESILGVPNVD